MFCCMIHLLMAGMPIGCTTIQWRIQMAEDSEGGGRHPIGLKLFSISRSLAVTGPAAWTVSRKNCDVYRQSQLSSIKLNGFISSHLCIVLFVLVRIRYPYFIVLFYFTYFINFIILLYKTLLLCKRCDARGAMQTYLDWLVDWSFLLLYYVCLCCLTDVIKIFITAWRTV